MSANGGTQALEGRLRAWCRRDDAAQAEAYRLYREGGWQQLWMHCCREPGCYVWTAHDSRTCPAHREETP